MKRLAEQNKTFHALEDEKRQKMYEEQMELHSKNKEGPATMAEAKKAMNATDEDWNVKVMGLAKDG